MSEDNKRIIVTGSRDWPDRRGVWRALYEQALGAQSVTVVHGDCPTGADRYAREWCAEAKYSDCPVTEERHPADWDRHGKSAGPIRNNEMVALGADVVLAFPLGASRGTRGCMRAADESGIPVITYEGTHAAEVSR
jgi:hypothetical protein